MPSPTLSECTFCETARVEARGRSARWEARGPRTRRWASGADPKDLDRSAARSNQRACSRAGWAAPLDAARANPVVEAPLDARGELSVPERSTARAADDFETGAKAVHAGYLPLAPCDAHERLAARLAV